MGFIDEKYEMDICAYTYNATLTTHGHGPAIDMKDANRIIFQVCHFANADDGVITWTVEESATTTDGDFAELAASVYVAVQTTAEINTWKTIEVPVRAMTEGKRYLRLTATETGGAHNAAVAAVATRANVFAHV